MPSVNWLAILLAVVVSMILGSLWYGPFFGKAWMKGMGWDPNNKEAMDKMKKSMGGSYFQMLVLSFVMFYVFDVVLGAFRVAMPGAGRVMLGLTGGFFTWLGYIVPVKYGDKLWGGKKLGYLCIDLGYYLVLLLIAGVILTHWM